MPLIVSTERNRGLSYTRNGVLIPPEHNPAKLYERLFVQGTPQEIERTIEDLRPAGACSIPWATAGRS
jgi:hypothetical protein